ncbi:MBL fold metallo-hydrolase [Abiotrophia defectiva]|uniref:MBL fold metallo-hydrolase n=1 Tax=Abiotrophia defectiva TaxID=46125 RepID=UPI0026EF37C1|nr:MBL fold metallo-hydrolase [Abiotrophia defectiva]
MSRLQSKFTLWPVGQGLFYSGAISYQGNNFNFIYDCGGDSQTISQEVNSYLKKFDNEIDMLVISHFDSDHINGLPTLFNGVKRINRIFIPYYGNLSSYLLLVAYVYGNGGTLSEKVNEIILVNTTESEGQEIMLNEVDELREENLIDKYSIRNVRTRVKGISKAKYNDIWEFKFYNAPLKNGASLNVIKNEIDKLMARKRASNLEELLVNHLSEVKQELKAIYNRFVSSHLRNSKQNQTSLCLYHAPLSGCNYYRCSILMRGLGDHYMNRWTRLLETTGTLLTGDISLKVKKVDRKYRNFCNYFHDEKDKTLLFLTPHHGAFNNWNPSILSDFPKVIFFLNSAGKTNKYGHPSNRVLKQILGANRLFLWANEKNGIEYKILSNSWFLLK